MNFKTSRLTGWRSLYICNNEKIPLHTGDVGQEASPEVEVGATLQAVVVAEQQGNEDA